MADAPSPYAPGIISTERVPPRPPGRVSVFLVATFAMTVATSGLYRFWSGRMMMMTGGLASASIATALAGLPAVLILLWAYLSDRVGLLGTRREGYVLLSSLMMAIVWLALAFGRHLHLVWMATALPTGLAAAVSRAAIIGALAEIGRRRAATSRLAAAHVGLTELAEIAVLPATILFMFSSIAWAAGVAVGLMLALAFLIVVLGDGDAVAPPPAVPRSPPVTIVRFLRSWPFWASAALLAFAGAATVPEMVLTRTLTPDEMSAYWTTAQWKTTVVMIGVVSVYLLICRRLRFDQLLRFALIAKAIGLAVHALITHATGQALPMSAVMARAAGDGLATVALLDLAFRVAPPGREAFGAILLAGLAGIVTLLAGLIELALGTSVGSVTWFATGAAIAAALAVSLLPPEIAEAREGRHALEDPVLGSPS